MLMFILPNKPDSEELLRKRLERKMKKEIVEKIERKIKIGIEFLRIIRSISKKNINQINPEIIRKRLEEYLEWAFSQYPQEIRRKAEELYRLQERLEDLIIGSLNSMKYHENVEEYYINDEKIDEIFPLKKRIDELSQEIDVRFLYFLKRGIAELLENLKKVLEIAQIDNEEEQKEYIVKTIKSQFFYPIEKESILNVQIYPFFIVIVLKEEFFKRINKDGKNFCGLNWDIFNLIKEGSNTDISETIIHETTHSLLRGFFSGIPTDVDIVSKIEEAYEEFNELMESIDKDWTHITIIGNMVERRRKIFLETLSLADIINSIHFEFLGDIKIIEHYLFRKNLFKGLSTSLKIINKTINILENIIRIEESKKDKKDEVIISRCKSLLNKLKEMRIRTIEYVRIFLFVSKHFKEKEIVYILLTIFSPYKYFHLEDYLRYRYGIDIYEGLKAFYKLITQYDISPDNLKAIIKVSDQIKEKISQKEKKILISTLRGLINSPNKQFVIFNFIFLKSFSLETVRRCFKLIQQLFIVLDIEREFSKNDMRKFEVFKKRMLVHFFLAFLKKSITENFRSLRDLLINLDHEEKELFEMVFFNFFKMGIAYKYFKEIYSDEKSRREIDEDFSSFIKSLPLWQELEKLGLTEKVEKSLENFASKKNR